jgi:hypothetical protein
VAGNQGFDPPGPEPFDDRGPQYAAGSGYGEPQYGPPSYGTNPYAPGPGGSGQSPYSPSGMLASAADRDRVLDVLKSAYGDGRLSKDEFDLRSNQVLAARHYGDLARIVGDLPGGGGFGPPPGTYPPATYPRAGYYLDNRPPTNGMAIGSLVCSLCGFIPPATILAVIFGHVARRQIRSTGQRGDGLAMAGLVIGYIGVAFWALILIVGIVAGA